MKRKALTTVGLCALAVALAQAGLRPASAHATQQARLTTTTIKVELHGSIIKMSAKTAPRGVVIFKVKNTNMYHHNFSINGRRTPVLLTGQSATLRVTFLRPGRYAYKCTLAHHAGWGQKGVFTIT